MMTNKKILIIIFLFLIASYLIFPKYHYLKTYHHNNGIIRKEMPVHFLFGANGTMTIYDREGNLKSEVNLKHRVQNGITKKYYESGEIESIQKFIDGKLDTSYFYFPSGSLKEISLGYKSLYYSEKYDSLIKFIDEEHNFYFQIPPKSFINFNQNGSEGCLVEFQVVENRFRANYLVFNKNTPLNKFLNKVKTEHPNGKSEKPYSDIDTSDSFQISFQERYKYYENDSIYVIQVVESSSFDYLCLIESSNENKKLVDYLSEFSLFIIELDEKSVPNG